MKKLMNMEPSYVPPYLQKSINLDVCNHEAPADEREYFTRDKPLTHTDFHMCLMVLLLYSLSDQKLSLLEFSGEFHGDAY